MLLIQSVCFVFQKKTYPHQINACLFHGQVKVEDIQIRFQSFRLDSWIGTRHCTLSMLFIPHENVWGRGGSSGFSTPPPPEIQSAVWSYCIYLCRAKHFKFKITLNFKIKSDSQYASPVRGESSLQKAAILCSYAHAPPPGSLFPTFQYTCRIQRNT